MAKDKKEKVLKEVGTKDVEKSVDQNKKSIDQTLKEIQGKFGSESIMRLG
jgi:hypothetical protein